MLVNTYFSKVFFSKVFFSTAYFSTVYGILQHEGQLSRGIARVFGKIDVYHIHVLLPKQKKTFSPTRRVWNVRSFVSWVEC